MTKTTREARQAELDARVADLRARADKKQAEADRLRGTVSTDFAFWSQPAYSNAGGRAFSRQRDQQRARIEKSFEIADEAKKLRDKADGMEQRGVVMAGDAEAERQAAIAAVDVKVGEVVRTGYGLRKVLKVNAKTVLVEGSFGPLKIQKHFVWPA